MSRLSEAVPGTNLNSVWLEARLVTLPQREGSGEVRRFQVRAAAVGPELDPSNFLVEARAEAFEASADRWQPGRVVRIIGRLAPDRWLEAGGRRRCGLKIIGEWIEPAGAAVAHVG